MKAAIFDDFGAPLEVRNLPDPVCPPDGVVISVEACGVCRSDWHAWRGADPDVSAPHVPGHEFAGTVEQIGSEVRSVHTGQRVTAPFILSCGACRDCRMADPTTCHQQDVVGFTRWGSFAELVAVPRADFNLVPLPDELPAIEAAGMGCRVTTAFRALVDRGQLQPGEWLVVHGCGGVGLAAIAIGVALRAHVVAIDVNPEALELASGLGAAQTCDVGKIDDVGATVREITDGGAHVSIDALGITTTFRNSLYSLRPLGRHIQIGMPLEEHATPSLPLLELVYARQISLIGTRGMAARRFRGLFDMIDQGRLNPAALVTRTIPLSEAGTALEEMNGYSRSGVTVINRFAE